MHVVMVKATYHLQDRFRDADTFQRIHHELAREAGKCRFKIKKDEHTLRMFQTYAHGFEVDVDDVSQQSPILKKTPLHSRHPITRDGLQGNTVCHIPSSLSPSPPSPFFLPLPALHACSWNEAHALHRNGV